MKDKKMFKTCGYEYKIFLVLGTDKNRMQKFLVEHDCKTGISYKYASDDIEKRVVEIKDSVKFAEVSLYVEVECIKRPVGKWEAV